MAQNWEINVYDGNHLVENDMLDVESNFATLRSSFSGTNDAGIGSPPGGQLWFDTTDKVLKVRNQAESAWLALMYGNSGTPMWMYVNAVPDGWASAGSLTDRVIAVKGGSTYTTGGVGAGGWTISPHTLPNHRHTTASASHNHQWYNSYTGYANDLTWQSNGAIQSITYSSKQTGYRFMMSGISGGIHDMHPNDMWTSNAGLGAGNTGYYQGSLTNNHGSAWRPAAAVGILVAPDA